MLAVVLGERLDESTTASLLFRVLRGKNWSADPELWFATFDSSFSDLIHHRNFIPSSVTVDVDFLARKMQHDLQILSRLYRVWYRGFFLGLPAGFHLTPEHGWPRLIRQVGLFCFSSVFVASPWVLSIRETARIAPFGTRG